MVEKEGCADYRVDVLDPDYVLGTEGVAQAVLYFTAPLGFEGTVTFSVAGPRVFLADPGEVTLEFGEDTVDDPFAEEFFISYEIPVTIGDDRGKYTVHATFYGPSGFVVAVSEETFFVK